MSDMKIICLGRLGAEGETAGVYMLPADECQITYVGKNRYVFWSRAGNFKTPEQERKEKTKGGERFIRCRSFVDDPLLVVPVTEADERAQELRQSLEEAGELAAEGPLV